MTRSPPRRASPTASALLGGIPLYRSATSCYRLGGSLFLNRTGSLFLGRSQRRPRRPFSKRTFPQEMFGMVCPCPHAVNQERTSHKRPINPRNPIRVTPVTPESKIIIEAHTFTKSPREAPAFRHGEESGFQPLGGNKFLCILPPVPSLNNATVFIRDALSHASSAR